MLHTDIRGDEGRQNAQLNQMNNLNVLPSNLARMVSIKLCQFSPYCRMYRTPSTGCAYSCSIQPDVPYTVHWLCLQLQHTAGCTVHHPLDVPTAAAYCRMYRTPSTGCAYSCTPQGVDFFSPFQGFHFTRPRNVQVSEKCQVVPQ